MRSRRSRCTPGAVCIFVWALVAGSGIAARAEWTLIPLPEVIVDPNEGETVGFLPVVLVANESKAVRSIFAPDVRYNDVTGAYPTLRFFSYPDPKQKYSLTAGKGTSRGEDFEANYTGQEVLNGPFDIQASVLREEDPFERFFGFGNNTPSSSETNYTSHTNSGSLFAGLTLPARLHATLQERFREVRVGQGGVTSLPQLRDPTSPFSKVNGADGATILGTRFGVTYDTRDVVDIPTQGVYADCAVEIVDKALGSSASFINYGVEGKAFLPLRQDKKYVLAVHSELDYMENGDSAPFFERNSVGGIHSLRGFGSNRFTDNDRFFAQAEFRSNLYEREIFGVRVHLEVAPFLDIGRVFQSSREFPIEDLHLAGGVGFRAVVVPQVVAYVDIGSAGSGPAAFTGIDYPF